MTNNNSEEREDKANQHDKSHKPEGVPPGPPDELPPGKRHAPHVPGDRRVG